MVNSWFAPPSNHAHKDDAARDARSKGRASHFAGRSRRDFNVDRYRNGWTLARAADTLGATRQFVDGAGLAMRRFALATTLILGCAAGAAERPYTPPRLDTGQPDMQGVWVASNATPLQ